MNIVILTSTIDEASMNERNFLFPFFSKTNLVFDSYNVLKFEDKNVLYLVNTDKHSVEYENVDEEIEKQIGVKMDLIVFATKHQSASGIHSLSCHTPGNWNNADYGGKEGKVCINPVKLNEEFYLKLKEVNEKENLGYEVIMECTHHGPYLETPCVFIEIGSDLESWKREDAGKAIAETIMEVLPSFNFEIKDNLPVAFCVGGLHHCPEFTKRIERKEAHIAHVMPKYIEDVSLETLEMAVLNSIPKCNLILYDWKGMSKNKQIIVEKIENLAVKYNLDIKKTKEFRN
jgi:D-aminoacyl-tRNA deacylase